MTTSRAGDAEPTTETHPQSGGIVEPDSLGVPSDRVQPTDESGAEGSAPRASEDPFDYRDETDRNAMNED
ncbi:MAG: hypothetical protein ACT4P1_16000 [Sporichthyaceae bacterium]